MSNVTHLEKIVSIDELYGVYREAHSDEAIVDVRPLSDPKNESFEGALQIPFEDVMTAPFQIVERLKNFRTAYLVCGDGLFAKKAYDTLLKSGSRNIMYVATGGVKEWVAKRYPHISKESQKQQTVEDWQLDYLRIEKKAFQVVSEISKQPGFAEKLLGKGVLDVNGSFIVWDLNTKEAAILFPSEKSEMHYFDQCIRKGLECKTIVGDGEFAAQLAKKFFASIVNPTDNTTVKLFNDATGTGSTESFNFLGLRWRENSITV